WYDYACYPIALIAVFIFDTMQLGEHIFKNYAPFFLFSYPTIWILIRSSLKATQWPRLPVTRREMGLALWCETIFLPSALIVLAVMLALTFGLFTGRAGPHALTMGLAIAGWQ